MNIVLFISYVIVVLTNKELREEYKNVLQSYKSGVKRNTKAH